jgi:hypothetical protein
MCRILKGHKNDGKMQAIAPRIILNPVLTAPVVKFRYRSGLSETDARPCCHAFLCRTNSNRLSQSMRITKVAQAASNERLRTQACHVTQRRTPFRGWAGEHCQLHGESQALLTIFIYYVVFETEGGKVTRI